MNPTTIKARFGMLISLSACLLLTACASSRPPQQLSLPPLPELPSEQGGWAAPPTANPSVKAPQQRITVLLPEPAAAPVAPAAPVPAPPLKPAAEPERAPAAPKAAAPVPSAKRQPVQEKPVKQAAQQQRLTLGQLVKKYPQLLLLRGSGSEKKAALTFDDAPDRNYTPKVLDILKKHGVQATFFLLGNQAEKYPDVVRRIVREGHVIGNHSYNHKLYTKLSDDLFRSQILQAQNSLKPLIGYSPRLLRPPYGEISESQLLWTKEQGYVVVNWNIDSLDWKQLSSSQVSSNILNHLSAGSIILQHSGGGPGQNLNGTVEALPHIIQTMKAQGYRLVTLPELLKVSKQL
ncbi:polysaccharide deacetylase family protein [Paenibacillus filicis]|uniref:Polysaccharide deacetylase family protein n=1 Tax=Paenibacillus gyeongsangnamensis TaxID=3388067 RepID=A0ABT4QLN2_9BACL|nr:polysaccharide deacetylase family protein [Paenibacillus filicis]MCZ8517754.1 polysaccharide deacetylase family protein [Paenibacillus filicis]